MKTRTAFVANSSTSVFIVYNKTDKEITWKEFIEEAYTEDDYDDALSSYDEMTKEEYLERFEDEYVHPGFNVFGGRDMIEADFDVPSLPYNDGESERFMWHEDELH